MKFTEDFMDDEIFDTDYSDIELDASNDNIEMAEVEVVLDEPARMVDVDGSVVLAEPGDIVTIKSESLKRIRKDV